MIWRSHEKDESFNKTKIMDQDVPLNRPNKNLFDVAEESVRGGLALFMGDALSTVILAVGSILIARFLGPCHK